MDATEARQALSNRGIPFREAAFLAYATSGQTDVVALFLAAGISANAAKKGKTVLALAAEGNHEGVCRLLLAAGADPIDIVKAAAPTDGPKRDGWDRLSALSGVFTFLSSLTIAAI